MKRKAVISRWMMARRSSQSRFRGFFWLAFALCASAPGSDVSIAAEPPSIAPEPGVGKTVIYEKDGTTRVEEFEPGAVPESDGPHRWLGWMDLATCRGATLGVRFRDDYGGYQFRAVNNGAEHVRGLFEYKTVPLHPQAGMKQQHRLLVGHFASDLNYIDRGLAPGQEMQERRVVVDRFVNAIPGDRSRQRIKAVVVDRAHIEMWSEFVASEIPERIKLEDGSAESAGAYHSYFDLPRCDFDVVVDLSPLVQAWSWPSSKPEKPNTFDQVIVFDGPRVKSTSLTTLGDPPVDAISSVKVVLDVDRSMIARSRKVELPREQFGRPAWALVLETNDPGAFRVSEETGGSASLENEGILYFESEADADSALGLLDLFRVTGSYIKIVAQESVSAAKKVFVDTLKGKESAADPDRAFAEALRKRLLDRMADKAADDLPEMLAQARFSKKLSDCSDEEFAAVMEESNRAAPTLTVWDRVRQPKKHLDRFFRRFLDKPFQRLLDPEAVR
jgi:hypothetical protein